MSPAEPATRKELIRREMRFVLQQNVRRFTKQLQARLLDAEAKITTAVLDVIEMLKFNLL